LIVDVLNTYYFSKKEYYDQIATDEYFTQRGLERGQYYLMTCHRRENVHIRASFENILSLLDATDRKIYFTASYRTQKVLKEYGLSLPNNVEMVNPIGYQEMLVLMVNSRGVLTDSGTVVEETCVLEVPSLQIRKATERPQVYDAGSSVKYDPTQPTQYPHDVVYQKLESLYGKKWEHKLGDGKASNRIVSDLLNRLRSNGFRMHNPEDYHLPIDRSYREDNL
jgi:UDP-N-acetylglucosamine 2-epimerase (non-hydrolysing)